MQLYNIGDSQRFWLTAADDNSYYIDYFDGADDYSPSTKRFDLSDNDGYGNVGNVVHVVKGNRTAMNKRWRFIRNDDGTYYVQNKLSGLYWALNDDGFENGRKLCQKRFEDAQKWEIEIVAADGEIPIEELKLLDSYTYDPYEEGDPVTSCNWMSHLPDDMRLSDVSIPGTHDSGTAHTDTNNFGAQCQNLSIHDQLYNGVRYFDLRFGTRDSEVTSPGHVIVTQASLVHGNTDTCLFNGEELVLEQVMEWITTFLERNPGETVIIQPKEDRGDQPVRTYVYNFFKKMVSENPELFYIGDHVPTMAECRGKILILSRLKFNNNYYKMEDGRQWAIDVSAWPERRDDDSLDDPLALAASGENYEIWDQDAYKKLGEEKWGLVWNSVFYSETGAERKRDTVRWRGKDALVVSYTSCADPPFHNPQGQARELNPKLKDTLREDFVLAGLHLGVVCSDFTDAQLTWLVYKQNFLNNKVVIRGITADGEEPFEEITVYIRKGINMTGRLTSMQEEIDAHFTGGKYVPHGAGRRGEIGQLCLAPLTEIASEQEYAEKTADLGKLNSSLTLYVALDTKVQWKQLKIDLPACATAVEVDGEDWTTQTEQPQLETGNDHVKVKAYWAADESASAPFAGEIAVGTMTVRAEPEMEWGYIFDDTYTDKVNVVSSDESFQTTAALTAENFGQKPLVITGIPIVHQELRQVAGKSPTCKEEGLVPHYVCDRCGHLFRDHACKVALDEADLRIPVSDEHTPGEPVVENVEGLAQPTCTEAGSYDQVIYCEVCGKELSRERRDFAALGHSWDDGTVTTEPTCTEPGVKTYTCTRDSSHTRTEEIPALGHDWGEWTVTKQATETEEGEETRTCANDPSHTQTRTIPVIGHVHELSKVEVKEPTCEEDGNIEYWICDGCGRYFSDEEGTVEINAEDTIIPGGHDWDEGTVTKEPGCTTEGTITYTCRRNPSHTYEKTIEPTGHKGNYRYEYQDVSAATCDQPAYQYEFCYCEDCGGLIECKLVEKSPALGHEWGEPEYEWAENLGSVTAKRVCSHDASHMEMEIAQTAKVTEAATCEQAGKITYTAAFQNEAFAEQIKEVELPALGHDWDEGVLTQKATCTEDGVMTYTCRNDESHTRTEPIPATGHIEAVRELDDNTATCTEGGVQTYEHYCMVCGEVLSTEQRATDPLGHRWSTPEYTWAEDNSTVTGSHTCDECGEHESETVPATMEDTGCIRTWYGDPFTNQCFEQQVKEEILPDKHDWGDWEVTKEPTCTEDGEEKRVCKFDDSHVETRVVEKLGHDWGETVYTWAEDHSTCTASRICKRDDSHEETETVQTTSEVTKAATCEDKGEAAYTAVFENEAFETQTMTAESEALGHDWGDWVVTKEATQTEEGEETRTCKNNPAHTQTRAIPKKEPAEVTYRNTSGDGQKWRKGSTEAAVFTFERSVNDEETFRHFTGILVDGSNVDASRYDAMAGSVIISLKSSYLEELAVGEHRITALFEDGNDPDAGFTILAAKDEDDQEEGTDPEDTKPEDDKPGDGSSQEDSKPGDGDQDDGKPGDSDQDDGKPGDGEQDDSTPGDGDQDDSKSGDGSQDDGKPGDADQDDSKPGDGSQEDGGRESIDQSSQSAAPGNSSGSEASNPGTGDDSHVTLWLGVSAASLMGLIVLLIALRRKTDHKQ